MSKNKNVPKLRFPGFTDEWEQRKVKELCSISTGKSNTQDKVDDGEYPFYVRSPIIERSTKYLYDEEAVLTVGDGVGTGKVFHYVNGKYDLHQRCYRMYDFTKELNARYFYHIFSLLFYNRVMAMTAKTSVDSVRMEMIADMEIPVPNIEEQKEIGSFLTNFDNLITLHQRKCEETKKLKKYMLQKMFPKNGEQFPKIRFEGFTDAWEQRKLGELCERVVRKNKNNESDLPLTISSQDGLIDQRDFFNRVVAAKDMSNYYLLQKGEFAYNKSYSNGYDYGSIKRLNAYEKGCLSTLYICFGITSKDVESDYLECFFDTLKWYDDVSAICAEGARNHGLLNVDTKAFFEEVSINIPSSKEEQRKISAYLNTLDNLITLHQRKCDELKKLKKYMLQNMFI